MPRILVISLLLLLLPLLIYLAVAYLRRSGTGEGALAGAPLVTLLILGVLLVLGSLAYLIETERGGAPGQRYIPPSFEDGVLKPGRSE
ncbi:MAG: hypothetical protein NW215_04715 [Hyphomicrobiales bacterium]|nr:hypothetical protein [Hyphomicrobiales bacterium]